MKKILLAWLLALIAPFSFGQSYPSPTYKNLTVNGSFTATGLVTTADLATQAANTVLANVTGGTASPSAVALPGCNSTSAALGYAGGVGFNCNSSINAVTLGNATWASPQGIGATTPNTGAFTSLTSTSGSLNGSIGVTTPNTGAFTTLSASTTNPSLTYTNQGGSAVAVNYQHKFGESVSVKDFGATGNGSTNDTTAIVDAISYVCTFSANRPRLYFPSGTYIVTTGSFNYCDGLQIWGDGPIASMISTASTTGNLFTNSSTTGTGIHNIGIVYSGTATSGYTMALTGASDFTAENLRITGPFIAFGILGVGVPQFFDKLDIENVANNGAGFYINGGSDQYITNVLIYSPSNTPKAGIEIQSSGGVWMTNVDAVHNNRGLLIDPQSGQTVEWLFIMNSAFDSSLVHAIDIIPGTGGAVYGSTFIGDWSASSTNVGFYMEGTGTINGVRIDSHRSFNNGQDGLIIATGTNIQISDSDFSGNSQSLSGTYNGITVAPGISGFSITGNRSGQMGPYANTQRYGILVNTGASNVYIITNNNATGNVTGNVQDNGTGASKVVNNNL